jgi:hypothetical protein
MGHRSWAKFEEAYINYLCKVHGQIKPKNYEEYSKISKSIDWKQLEMLKLMYEAGFYDGIKCNREYDPLWDAD